jgi:hypothetical protein
MLAMIMLSLAAASGKWRGDMPKHIMSCDLILQGSEHIPNLGRQGSSE